MNKEQNISDISRLILKELYGELSIEERALLDQWSDKSESNRKLREQLRNSHTYQNEYKNYQQVKSSDDWLALRHKIDKKPVILWRKAMRYVAVFLVISGVAFGIYRLTEREEVTLELVKHEPVPGSSKAVLTTAEGETIELGRKQKEPSQLLDKYGILDSDTSLEYKPVHKYDEYHTLEVPRGGEYILKLADGSRVWLNAETVLKFPVQFTQNERKVYLISGEAYFQVAKDRQKPFHVECAGMDIEVTGTEFNVMAYTDKKEIATTLVKGGVSISCGKEQIALNPSEQAVYSRTSHSLTKHPVDAGYYTSWKDGVFEFSEMPLAEVMEQLGRWYNIHYLFLDEQLKQIPFTGAIKRSKDLEFILNIIRDTQHINYEIDDNIVIIKKSGL